MKRVFFALLSGITMITAVSVKAQTVDDVIAKHLEAIGGKEKIKAIKTVYMETELDVMGSQAPGAIYIVNGKGFRNEMNFNGQTSIQVTTDKGGWTVNPGMGQTAPEPMTDEQVKLNQGQLQVGGPLLDHASKGSKVELLGTEEVGDVKAYKIKVVTKENGELTMYLDPATYYVIKMIKKMNVEGQEMETTINYSDYKKTDYGYVVPTSTEVNMPTGLSVTMKVTKIEVNKDIDMKIFEM